MIRFTCPNCGASHTRGYINGVDTFRCFGCGYIGTDNAFQGTTWKKAVLDYVGAHPGMTATHVANALGLKGGTVSSILCKAADAREIVRVELPKHKVYYPWAEVPEEFRPKSVWDRVLDPDD